MGKILFNDLASVLAERHQTDKKSARMFLNSVLDIITNALTTDKVVKIKGLGTFKIVEVDSRESINITTGERLTIEGHSKISFLPDNFMKELVNRPFSIFETVVLNDGVNFDEDVQPTYTTEEEEEEEADNSYPAEEAEAEAEEHEESNEPEQAIEPVIEIVDDTTLDDPATEENEPEEHEEETRTEEVIDNSALEVNFVDVIPAQDPTNERDEAPEEILDTQEENEEAPEEEEEEEYEEPRKRSKAWIWCALLAVLLIGGGLGAWYFLGKDSAEEQPQTEAQKPTASTDATKPDTKVEAEPKDSTQQGELAKQVEETANGDIPIWEQYNNKDIRTREGAYYIMGVDSILTTRKGDNVKKIAKMFFGSTEMSCYIEVLNGISAADVLEPGTKLKIPKIEMKSTVRKRLSNSNQQ